MKVLFKDLYAVWNPDIKSIVSSDYTCVYSTLDKAVESRKDAKKSDMFKEVDLKIIKIEAVTKEIL